MFADYRYRPILRLVQTSNEPEPKNDPVLISGLHGVSGLLEYQTDKGYFSEMSNNLETGNIDGIYFTNGKGDNGRRSYTTSILQAFDFDLIPTSTVRTYTILPLDSEKYIISHNVLIYGPTDRELDDQRDANSDLLKLYNYLPDYSVNKDKTSLSDYATLTYNDLIGGNNQARITDDFRFRNTVANSDYGKVLKNVDGYTIKQIKDDPSIISNQLSTTKTVNQRIINDETNNESDFIDFKIHSISRGVGVSFTVFLTSFNDSFNASWQDLKYVGRQDTLKYFTGVTRAASVGFKVAAFNPKHMTIIYNKLDSLVKGTVVGGIQNGAKTITAPYCQLTLGHWFDNTFCVVNSLKFDVQTADYAWDVRDVYQMPQLIDVSMDFTILGDKHGAPLNASSNNFFFDSITA